MTFAFVVGLGLALMGASMWALGRLGTPTWVTAQLWVVPTALVLAWTVVRPEPAIPTDSDDDTWPGYAIRFGLVGDTEPRPTAIRIAIALVVGAPVAWSILVIGTVAVIGLSG